MAGSVSEVWQIVYKSLCSSRSRCCCGKADAVGWGKLKQCIKLDSIGWEHRYSFTEVISNIRHCGERVANGSANWRRKRHCGKRLIICNIRRMQRHFRFPLSRLATTTTTTTTRMGAEQRQSRLARKQN